MNDAAPLPLVPVAKRALWGGDSLPELIGLAPPTGREPVAEAWLAHGDSVVASGSHAGETLAALARRFGADLLGRAAVRRYGRTMPLLAKFLDARLALSVQVHPNDAYAAQRHAGSGHLGKTESWLVLRAEEGATVTWGFRRPVTAAEVRAAAMDGSLPGMLRAVPVVEGDVVHNPAGTVHAVGAGLLIYELQQASDLTYRLFDHGRRGADGHLRALHLADGLAVADLEGGGDPRPPAPDAKGAWTPRVACPFYALDEVEVRGSHSGRTDADAMEILTVLRGHVDLAAAGGRTRLGAGGTVVLPAQLGAYELAGDGRVVRGRPTG